MKINVNEDCIGCGLCAEIAPENFKIEDGVSVAQCDVVLPAAEADCRDAAESCPVAAIEISG